MSATWDLRSARSWKLLMVGFVFLIAAAAYMAMTRGVVSHLERENVNSGDRFSTAETAKLASPAHVPAPVVSPVGVVGGVPGGIPNYAKASATVTAGDTMRKIVRKSSLELTVKSPADAVQRIAGFAGSLGGYVETAQVSDETSPFASITIRVPSNRMEEARKQIAALGLKVQKEQTEARDVTKEYVDMDARLRNLKAEEAQYLEIMKSARKVQDMLDVSEHLSAVRGEIEQQQAELVTLSREVDLVAITVTLRAEPAAQVAWLDWHPTRQLKLALRDALDALADYAGSMVSVVLFLPVVLLWAATIIVGMAGAWRGARWVGRTFFGMTGKPIVERPA